MKTRGKPEQTDDEYCREIVEGLNNTVLMTSELLQVSFNK